MRRSLGALVVLLATLSACTSGHDQPHPPAPHVNDLSAAWSATMAFVPTQTWVSGTTLAVADEVGRLAGIDTNTGRPAWRLRLGSTPCAWSAPSPAGLLAVLTRTRKPNACETAVLVDLRRGKVLWTRTVAHLRRWAPADFDGVSIGDSVVAMTDSVLSTAARLDLHTGRILSTSTDDRSVLRVVSDGRHLFSLRPQDDTMQHVRVLVTDQDTGHAVGSFPARDSYELHPLPGAPELIGADRGRGGTYLWSATTGQLVGRGMPDAAVVDGQRLVAAYPGILVIDDLRSGKELAAVPLEQHDELLGVSDGDAIVRSELGEGINAVSTIERFDLADPDSAEVLGVLPDYWSALSGGTVYASTGHTVSAYPLPADGPTLKAVEDSRAWAPGDLRPAEVLDACLSVSADVRKQTGADPTAPVDGSCTWGSGGRLSISTTAVEPADDDSAVDVATEELAGAGPDATKVQLGDGASLTTVRDAIGGTDATLTVRWRNVIVRVEGGGHRSARAYRAAVIAAARQVLAELERRAA